MPDGPLAGLHIVDVAWQQARNWRTICVDSRFACYPSIRSRIEADPLIIAFPGSIFLATDGLALKP